MSLEYIRPKLLVSFLGKFCTEHAKFIADKLVKGYINKGNHITWYIRSSDGDTSYKIKDGTYGFANRTEFSDIEIYYPDMFGLAVEKAGFIDKLYIWFAIRHIIRAFDEMEAHNRAAMNRCSPFSDPSPNFSFTWH